MNRRNFLKSFSAACAVIGIAPNLILPDKQLSKQKQITHEAKYGLLGGLPVAAWTLTQECLDADLKRLAPYYKPKHFRTTGDAIVYEGNVLQVGNQYDFILYKGDSWFSGKGIIIARDMFVQFCNDFAKSKYEFITINPLETGITR